MMEDTGEDILRPKPSFVSSLAKKNRTDLPSVVRPVDPSHNVSLDFYRRYDSSLPTSHRSQTGLVHRHVCPGHLPPEPVTGLPHPKDRSCLRGVRGGRGGGRGGRHGTANHKERRVQAIHQTVARVQVLVLCDEGDCDRLFLHLFRVLQHTCLLANPSHVLHHTFLHHHEKTNKAYDTVSIHPLYIRKAKVPGQGARAGLNQQLRYCSLTAHLVDNILVCFECLQWPPKERGEVEFVPRHTSIN